jgi:hypothetical protein
MAKIKQLEKSLKDKSKKEAEELRFGDKTEKQKKFLKENPNVKTAAEMDKMIADKKSVGGSRMGPFMNKGGRVGLKAGSKGCKLAKRGRGRAYGKNS